MGDLRKLQEKQIGNVARSLLNTENAPLESCLTDRLEIKGNSTSVCYGEKVRKSSREGIKNKNDVTDFDNQHGGLRIARET